MATGKSFEQQVLKLESLIDNLENNSLTLDEYMKNYSEANKILYNCYDMLGKAKQKITKIDECEPK